MTNPIESVKTQIGELLEQSYERAAASGLLPGGAPPAGTVEIPRDPSMGDWASSAAMAAAKSMRMPPRKIAEALMEGLKLEDSWLASAEVAGAGFLNFRLSDKWYAAVLEAVEALGGDYGRVDVGHGKKIMLEFVSANPTGPMTIGNARGGVLGDTMAEVMSRAGYDVWREFYVNDAGHQVEVFGRSVEARYIQLIKGEDAVEFPEEGYHGEDIRELAAEYRAEFGDGLLELPAEERRARLVEYGLKHNIERMKRDLVRYRVNYDQWFLESSLHESGYVADTVDMLEKKGLCYEKDGALWLRLTDYGAEKDEVLRRSNGFYTYFAVDMAYHRNKFIERGFEKVIDVWGADHHGHAIRFKKALPALGIEEDRLDFILMQFVRLVRDGETVKVSKRTGKAIALADLLDEISVDACRFFFNARPDTHLDFDMDLAVRQDSENPVYYVQYAHARIATLVETLAADGVKVPAAADVDVALLSDPCERELIKQIAALPEEIRLAARDYDPSRINKYAVELAARFHRFYNSCRIRGAEPALRDARLKLADTTRAVLKTALGILGVTAPDKM